MMEVIIIYLKNKVQLVVIKYILNSLNIPFDKTKKGESFYNSDFNEKMERASGDRKAGRYKSIKAEDLWK